MKKLITLAFCLYVMPGLFAQNVQRYDSNSPWFFGVNVGAAWNSTDIKNETNAGWGLTFGRNFATRPDALFSWDLRLRYLQGNWYGQDYDTTNLAGYNPTFDPPAYQAYEDNPGYTVNNFTARNHHLGLEAVLHANRLRQRTGWDPYIFGGINVTWNQSFSDLVNVDSAFGTPAGQYQYDPDVVTDNFLGTQLDGVYETAMNPGSVGGDYNVNWMPSIGVGLAYYFGPRFAIGVEHLSTFTRKDDWDGYIDPTPGLWNRSNDIYHYTSGFLRFHLRGGATTTTNTNTTNNNIAPCPDPIIALERPTVSGTTVENQVYSFRARIDNINSIQNVRVRVNGTESNNFFYSTGTELLEGSIVLREGSNTIQVVATNSCGTDTETIAINYEPCRAPIVRFTDPSQNSIHVENPAYRVRANIANGGSISFTVNGAVSSNFLYQQNTGSFESTVNLRRGSNTITITSTNDCGTDTETITIEYTDCEDPRVNFLAGNGSVINVTDPFALIRATISGIDNRNAIGFRVNGANRTFNYNVGSGQLEANVSLTPGANRIQITVGNDCGTDIETMTVNYTPCMTPRVSILTPARSGSMNTSGTQLVEASITNATNVSQIQMLVNGVAVAGGNYNPATRVYSNYAALNSGTNIIQIVVTNECGSDSETTNVQYNAPCPLPMISLVSTIGNTHQATMPIEYAVQNVTSASQIQLTLNGVTVQGGFFNGITNVFSATLALTPGPNTITINATNNCGADSETIVVYYTEPCDEPIVAMINPIGNQLSVTESQFDVQAILQNITNANQVELSVNGSLDISGSYNHITQVYHNNINLQPGLNTVMMSVDNGCGVETEIFVIDYSPCLEPVVSITAPTGGSTQNGTTVVTATVLNVNAASDIQAIVNGTVYTGSYNATLGTFTANVPLNAGNNAIQVLANNECGSASSSVCISYAPCTPPTVQLISNPRGVTNNQNMTVQAQVAGVSGAGEITATHNGNTVNGTYNAQTGMYTFSLTLTPGVNMITVTAANDCGSDTQSTTVTYVEPCDIPQVSITSPANGANSANATVQLAASVVNITSASQVQLLVNGAAQTGSLNTNTGLFSANINLSQGANTIQVIVTNACGSASETITVLYRPCLAPTVQLVTPQGGVTQNASTSLQAVVMNVSSANDIVLTVNGSPVSGSYNAQSNMFTANITLSNGSNTIVVAASNRCGNDSKSVSVRYDEPCLSPQLSIATPTNNAQVATNTVQIAATIINISSAGEVQLLVNGTNHQGTYNNTTGAYTATVPLQSGANIIEIIASNDCGTASETVMVKYRPCVTPNIQIVSPLQATTTHETVTLQAVVTGVTSANDINATLNGNALNGTYNAVTHTYTAQLTLNNGSNTIGITATNSCGTDSHVKTITYDEPCTGPQIVFNTPANGAVVDANTIKVSATVSGVKNASEIKLMVNGTPQQGAFNATTGEFIATVTLHQGANAIVLSATNDCGTEKESLAVKYIPCQMPTVSITSPQSGSTNGQTVTITAQVANIERPSAVWAMVNGKKVTGQYEQNGTFTVQANLNTGSNTIVIQAGSECGMVEESITLVYDQPCDEPVVHISTPADGSETSANQVTLTAKILNISGASNVEVYVNGQIVSGGAYDASTKMFKSNIPIDRPINKITVYAVNDCGKAEGKVIVSQVSEPTMVICNPTSTGGWEQIEIPVSEWPQYQAAGASQGECSAGGVGVINTNGTGNGSTQQNGSGGGTQTNTYGGQTGGGLIPIGGGSNNQGGGTTGGNTGGTSGGTTGGGNNTGGGESGNGGRPENTNGSGTIKVDTSAQEAAAKKAAQEAAAKKAAQEAAAKKAAQEAAAKKAAQEAAAKKAAQEAAAKKAAQEAAAKKAAQEAAAKKAAQEAAAKKAAQEAAAKKAAQEAAAKKAAQEAAAKKAAQEAAAAKKAAQEAAAKKAAQEAAAKKAAQEAAAKKAAQEAAAKKAAQEAAAAKKAAQEAAAKKKAAEEAAKKKAEEEKKNTPTLNTSRTTGGGIH